MYRDIRELVKVDFGMHLLELTIPPGFVNFSVLNAFNWVIFFFCWTAVHSAVSQLQEIGALDEKVRTTRGFL